MTRFDPVATYASSNPFGLAVVDLESDRRWTYAELSAAVDRLAAWLVGEFGPNSGARVATLTRNCAEMLILQLAGARRDCSAGSGRVAGNRVPRSGIRTAVAV